MVIRKHHLRGVVDLASALFGIVVAGLVLGAWMLAQGPLALPFLVPRIEAELTRAAARADLAAAVRVDGVALTWRRETTSLDLTVLGVRLMGGDGAVNAQVDRVVLRPDLAALVGGALSVDRIVIDRPLLHVIRQADGRLELGMAGAALPAPGRMPAPDPTTDPPPPEETGAEDGFTAADLREAWRTMADLGLSLRDAALVVTSAEPKAGSGSSQHPWHLTISDLRTGREGQALALEASARIGAAGPGERSASRVDIAARAYLSGGPISVIAMLDALDPGRDLAEVLGVRALAGWRQPLDGTVTLDLDPAALLGPDPLSGLLYGRLSLRGRPGSLALPAPIDHAWAPQSLRLDVSTETTPDGARAVVIEDVTVTLPDVALRATGRLTEAAGGAVLMSADLSLSGGLTVPTIIRHWPAGLADGAREWIGENMSVGTVGESRLSLSLGGTDWDSLDLLALKGESPVSGMTVDYLDGLPPATGASGSVHYGPTTVTIDLDGGGVGDLLVTDGSIAFTDLDSGMELADMVFRIQGPFSDALDVIDHDPLGYARRVGIDPAKAIGQVDVTLGLAFPLLKDLPLDDLEVSVTAEATGAGLPAVALGQDLSEGNLTLTLDMAGMDVTGRAHLGDVPITLDWRENFEAGQGFDRRYEVSGRIDNAARARFSLSGAPFQPPWLDGPVDATLRYTETAGQPGRLVADVDLSPATIEAKALAWRKPRGVPGRAHVEGDFSDQAMTVAFDVTTASAGAVHGDARLTGDGDLRSVTLDRLTMGQTDARLRLAARSPDQGGGYQISVSGPVLDLRAALDDDDQDSAPQPAPSPSGGLDPPPPEQAEPPGPPLAVAVDVGRLWLTDSVALEPINLTASRDGAGHWTRAALDGRIGAGGGGPIITGRLEPSQGARLFQVQAGDAGAVAAALDVTDQMRGGTLSLSGRLLPDDSAEGVLDIDSFRLDDAPVLARILAVAALTGVLDELQGGGLSMSRLHAPFRYDGRTLTLNEARTNGTALGLTAGGAIDLERDRLDLKGVIVPIYAVNAVLGNIPLLGDLLVGEKGGGVFALSYSARGPLDDPAVSVNPLSALTPGFLRGLFDVLPDGGDGTEPPRP